MSPTTYRDVLARNVRAARSRCDISQQVLAGRMRALGYDAWLHQTVGNVEKGKRRMNAEEIFGLAAALQTSIGVLMSPVADDKIVDFPSGAAVTVESVQRSVQGQNDGAVMWDGERPIFPAPLSTSHQLAVSGIASWSRVSRSTGDVTDLDPASGEWVPRKEDKK
jgi:transcriptional regulator with XRE-family HTH domain